MILITTPDYLPRLGGLTTLTLDLEKVLNALGIKYEVFHWSSQSEIISYPNQNLEKYKLIINVHFLFGYFKKKLQGKMINIIHGSEVMFSSPIWWKRIVKKALRAKMIAHLESCQTNLFISEFTFNLMTKFSYKTNYGRDVVYHNGIDTASSAFISKDLNSAEVIKFVCIARDVKHKNLAGCVKLCEMAQDKLNKKVQLTLPKDAHYTSSKISIVNLNSQSEEDKNKAYADAHFNLLLSSYDPTNGFMEGFGLTVLESAVYSAPSIVMRSGGLTDSVHENETGWVMNHINTQELSDIFDNKILKDYERVSKKCFDHTTSSHRLSEWGRIFGSICEVAA
ncbi:MAG: glycosyltransferase family 4 protein [Bacteriovorax sp.]|nr:glycosyltransferase family 4 protein [Bacteriovorax sp.]